MYLSDEDRERLRVAAEMVEAVKKLKPYLQDILRTDDMFEWVPAASLLNLLTQWESIKEKEVNLF